MTLRVGDGNETDSAMFGKLVTQFKQQWNIDALFVADAALYTAGNLTQMSQLRWVSRVPVTLAAAKQLSSQQFACQPDALQAATAFSDQLPYHQLDDLQVVEIIEDQKRGRPRKDELEVEIFDGNERGDVKKLFKMVREFEKYIANNSGYIANYGERWRNGEAIATGFVESTVDRVITKRFVKKQQMRWTSKGAHLLLQVRLSVLNEDFRSKFQQWYLVKPKSELLNLLILASIQKLYLTFCTSGK